MTHNFYLAARYSIRDEIRVVRERLRSLGHVVTARWLDSESEGTGRLPADQLRTFAIECYEDIAAADHFILFTQDPKEPFHRGGRMVEFGLALRSPLRTDDCIWVVGPVENIFVTLADRRFDGAEELYEFLERGHV